MCGIVGTIDAAESRAEVRVTVLNESQQHRGPDHSVLARVGFFTFGNTRLAIQDPGPAGNQPFVSSDGRYHCVFNGEIYNIAVSLSATSFRCGPDATERSSPSCGPSSDRQRWPRCGDVRYCTVDSLEERLYLARDPFGIKPLYWRVLTDGPVVFASEVRPLTRVVAGVRISGEAIARYLHLGAMAADQSPFEEIIAVPPNGVASFDRTAK